MGIDCKYNDSREQEQHIIVLNSKIVK